MNTRTARELAEVDFGVSMYREVNVALSDRHARALNVPKGTSVTIELFGGVYVGGARVGGAATAIALAFARDGGDR